MINGYGGTILRIDLGIRTVKREPVTPELAYEWLGGRAWIAKYMYDELRAGVDPLGPENKVFVAAGPLSGTLWPSSAKLLWGTKSPLTGGYIDSNMGGLIMAELKYAGVDMIILEGASDKPVYLFIDDDRIEIRDASQYWGEGSVDTEYALKRDLGDDFQIATIGPAGENLIKFACITHDIGRQAGRGGVGAVLGSKKLKAIAVRGTKPIPVADIEGLQRHTTAAIDYIRHTAFFPAFSKYGTTDITDWCDNVGVIPVNNFQHGQYAKRDRIDGKYMREHIYVRDKGCYACPLGCSTYSHSEKYGIYVEGPEYETIGLMGSNLGMDSIDEIAVLNADVDNLGMDSISSGSAIAFAMELYQRGILTRDDFGGLEMTWGNVSAAREFLKLIASRAGIGAVFAEGALRASHMIGRDTEKYVVQVKGLDYSAYDTHAAPAMMLAYMTSDIGAQHTRAWAIVQDINMGRESTDGKGKLVYDLQHLRPLMEVLGVCRFPWLEVKLDWENYVTALNLVTGQHYTTEGLFAFSERVWNLTRAFWTREVDGFGRAFDQPPARMFEPMPDGPTAGARVTQTMVDQLLDGYYDAYRWDRNGLPTAGRLREVGLGYVADDLVKRGRIQG
ncbi:MAG: aldehyde ferredoxin oxidoreductase family protein [Candidatus Cryosericum sp.]